MRFREFMTARAAPDAVVFPGRASAVSNIPIRVPEHYIGRDDALAAIEAALARHEGAVLTADRHCYAAGWSFLLFLGFLRGSDKVMLFPTRRRRMRQPIGYGRFARAADAIRFAIEELQPELLPAAQLKVAQERFDGDGIRRLYEDAAYPLKRAAVTSPVDKKSRPSGAVTSVK